MQDCQACLAIYYRLQGEPHRWPVANRAHQGDTLAWNECSQLTFAHEAYNPEPAAVGSHGKALKLLEYRNYVAWTLVGFCSQFVVEECEGKVSTCVPGVPEKLGV